MKRGIAFQTLFLAFLSVTAIFAQETAYYYYRNQPMPLTIDRTRLLIKFENYSQDEGQVLILARYPQLWYDPEIQVDIENCGLFGLYPGINYDSIVTSLRGQSMVRAVNPVIAFNDSVSEYVGETIVCKFAPTVSRAEIDSLAATYHLIVGSENEYMPGEYVLQTTKQTGYGTIEIANIFHTLEQTLYSHPNFYGWIIPDAYQILDEYYLSYQSNIQKVSGLPDYPEAAWEITTGDPDVYIAVVDNGIGPHEDLDSTHFTYGYDFVHGGVSFWTLGATETDITHGMEVGGLILARHNNIVPTSEIPDFSAMDSYNSVAGLAPECRAYSVRILDSLGRLTSADTVGRALGFAFRNGAAVMNCCWTYLGDPVESIENPIDSAYQYGRNGLGTVIVFSSGNKSGIFYDILWPKTKENVLAVGAIDADDNWLNYSRYGSTLDLVATSGPYFSNGPGKPYGGGGIWTTDLMDSAGLNPALWDGCGAMNDMDYDCTFNGTSAAAPLVSGAAALLISRRPDLTAGQVMEVLKNSAVTQLQWGSITPPDTYYGYGRVNALRALVAVCRGDANNDKWVDMGDAIHIVNYIFHSGPPPEPHPGMADADCDGLINIGDAVFIMNYVYRGGPAPGFCYLYDY